MRGLPILDWLPGYRRAWLRGDLAAGLTVGVMLIPQGMAYAMIAGLPPVYGLYAALVPQLAYAVLGTSRQLAVGPVAMDSLLVASGLGAAAAVGEANYVTAAVFLGLLTGAVQMIFGIFRLGFLVNFLSRPVVSGFTSAAAVVIGVSQFKHVLGVRIADSSRLQVILARLWGEMGEVSPYAVVIGLSTIALIALIRRYGRGIPSALVVVVLGTAVAALTDWYALGLPIVGEVPAGLPGFAVPGVRSGLFVSLLPIAVTLALIGYMEAMAIGRAARERVGGGYDIDANQELVALGAGNVFGSLWSSYPATASFSRTAINADAGARTSVAALVSAAVVAGTLLFLTDLFYFLPNAVLGAIILAAVFKLVDVRYAAGLWRRNRVEALLLTLTFVVTLTVGMVEGILAGVFASLAWTVYRDSTPHIAEIARVRGTDYFRNVERFAGDCEVRPDVLMFRFDAPVFFGNAGYFKDQLLARVAARGGALQTVVVNAEAITYVDDTGQHMLCEVIAALQARGLRVVISGAIGPARDSIVRGRVGALIGEELMFVRSSEVIDYLDGVGEPGEAQRRIARQARAWEYGGVRREG